MTPGQPFNPYRQFKNFVIIPIAVVESDQLSMGARIAYGRLACHKATDSTDCFVKRETLASELKVSVDTVDRYLKELTTLALIKPIRRGQQQNAYRFLGHEMLSPSLKESADSLSQEPPESADLRSQEAEQSGQICGAESADLRIRVGKSAERYKEEKGFEKGLEKESSSKQLTATREPQATTTTSAPPDELQNPAAKSPSLSPELENGIVRPRTRRGCEIRVLELQPFRERMRDLLGFKKLPVMSLARFVIRTAGGSAAASQFLTETAKDLETRCSMRPRRWAFFRVAVREWAERRSADPQRPAASLSPTRQNVAADVRSPSGHPPALQLVTAHSRPSWWTAEELLEARAAMGAHRGSGPPDPQIAMQVLQHFAGMEEFRLWFSELARRFPGRNVQTFGLYEADARKNWPGRRQELEAQQKAAAARSEALNRKASAGGSMVKEEHRAYERERRDRAAAVEAAAARGWRRVHPDSDCNRCLGFGRDTGTEQLCSCRSGSELTRQLEHCRICDDVGYNETQEGLWEWCACVHATRLRDRQPRLVEEANAVVLKLRKSGTVPRLAIM
jgi:hypothetical protein